METSQNEGKKVLLSGVKPTGRPHIGNYFGAMKQFVDLSGEFDARVFIANYHALTTISDADAISRDTLEIAIDYLAIGLDPERVTLFRQSDVPEVTELAWIFNCITTVPYLMRAHAYKDATAKGAEVSVGTFDYPLLMAADILIHDAHVVPVGLDQKQHIEYARDTAEKFNRTFGETFRLPEALILGSVEIVPGLDGRKMSKSYGNTIPLFAEDDEIRAAAMKVTTDSKGVEEPKDPETCHVFALHKLVATPEELGEIERAYREGGMGYKESKERLADELIRFITPLRERRREIAARPEHVREILRAGGERARAITLAKMRDIRAKVGVG